ncbi:MAG TPA: dienelactone hydrolase [Verrucomicrobiae bacterium]|nr:dienelactone hydrolase [Verrucomicrobiae bacterium]
MNLNVCSLLAMLLNLAAPAICGAEARGVGYDPLAVEATGRATHLDTAIHDAGRGRDIPIRAYLPANSAPAPVILFSHGLGGSRLGSAFLGEHWAARGYVAVFMQHPGSDESVWRGKPVLERMADLERAASRQNFLQRVQDVKVVLDQLETWNRSSTNQLAGRLDLSKVGMSGHSFGAVTTEAVSGETLPVGGSRYTDPRIRAALVLSPSAPAGGGASRAFDSVNIPWMLMTGTRDIAPIGHVTLESRLAVYPALHRAPKYELVLNKAEHSVFTERALPGDREPRNPNHHRVILALSTAFWDAYLRGDEEALRWLNGAGPRSVMEPKDQWQASIPER